MLVHKLVYDVPSWWDAEDPQAEKMRDSAIRKCARLVSYNDTHGTFKLVDTLPMETLVALELWRKKAEERATTNRRRMKGIHGKLREHEWSPE